MMKRFKVIWFDDANDVKAFKVFMARDENHAVEKCKTWLRYNTDHQLGTVHDCIELKPLKKRA